jgi:hypothetical protein
LKTNLGILKPVVYAVVGFDATGDQAPGFGLGRARLAAVATPVAADATGATFGESGAIGGGFSAWLPDDPNSMIVLRFNL